MSLERPVAPDPYDLLPPIPEFALTSADCVDGAKLPLSHAHPGAGGRDLSPQLAWSGFPSGTQSFTVTCFDPDAPTGSGFWHWVLVNLPVTTTALPEGAGDGHHPLPRGAFHVRNDYGSSTYGGACPPAGDRPHRYIFGVHAVDVPALPLDPAVSCARVGFNLTFHALARARLTATFAC